MSSAKIDQKAYLKRYLSGSTDSTKKKKKRKDKEIRGKSITIIDANLDVDRLEKIQDEDLEVFQTGEDAPQVVGVVDDRPPELRALDFKNSTRWKVISDDNGFESDLIVQEMDANGRIRKNVQKSKAKKSVSFGRNDSDASPPRRKRSISPDLSPMRKGHREDSDASPPRRKNRSSPDQSPPRRRKNDGDEDLSPVRKRSNGSPDCSPPRRRQCPQRSRRTPSPSRRPRSPKRRQMSEDRSPPRRKRDSSRDLSPARKNINRSPDRSPPRRRDRQSPARNHRQSNHSPENRRREKKRWDSPDRRGASPDRRKPRDDSPGPSSSSSSSQKKMEKTLDGKMAGLQSAKALRVETEKFREREKTAFESMNEEMSGRDAQVVHRDRRTGRRRNMEEEMEREREKDEKEKERKKIYDRWGAGVKQVEEHQRRRDEEQHEMSKPVARYAGDADLEEHLRKQERDGDPMLAYMREKERERKIGSGQVVTMPKYQGTYVDNRFGIPPGYRWDGVDRSNGYEKKYFDVLSRKKAGEEEAYRYSTEDM